MNTEPNEKAKRQLELYGISLVEFCLIDESNNSLVVI